MFRRNCGRLDRAVRLVVGVILVPVGLFLLDGLHGDLLGQVVTVIGILNLVTGASGFCVLYAPFGISTVEKKKARQLPTDPNTTF